MTRRRYIAPPDRRDIVPQDETVDLLAPEEETCGHCGQASSDVWVDGFCGPCHDRGAVACQCAEIRAEQARARVPDGPSGTVPVQTPGLCKGDVVVDDELAKRLGLDELEVTELRHHPWGYHIHFRGYRPPRRRHPQFPAGRWFHVMKKEAI